MKTAAEIEAWLIEQVAAILSVPADEVDPTETFDSFGLASRDAVSLSGDLEDYLQQRLSPTLLYQYPTIRALAAHLAAPAAAAPAESPVPATRAAPVSEQTVAEMSDEEAEAALLRKLLELDE
jgi:acyl carrier protein